MGAIRDRCPGCGQDADLRWFADTGWRCGRCVKAAFAEHLTPPPDTGDREGLVLVLALMGALVLGFVAGIFTLLMAGPIR